MRAILEAGGATVRSMWADRQKGVVETGSLQEVLPGIMIVQFSCFTAWISLRTRFNLLFLTTGYHHRRH